MPQSFFIFVFAKLFYFVSASFYFVFAHFYFRFFEMFFTVVFIILLSRGVDSDIIDHMENENRRLWTGTVLRVCSATYQIFCNIS